MRTTQIIGFWAAMVVASSGLLGQETFSENGAKVGGRGGVPDENADPGSGVKFFRSSPNVVTGRASAGDPGNRWRYRFHNGHWWYYGRSNQWSYWTGNAWTPYDRQTYAGWWNSRFQPYDMSDYGRRPSKTIQNEKNESRTTDFGLGGSGGHRPPKTVQNQKNESRTIDFGVGGTAGRRPPKTVQNEKNSPRGEE